MSGGEDPVAPTAKVQVPALVGEPVAEARQLLADAKLEVGEESTEETTDPAKVGTVLSHTPASGAEVDEGSEVDLVVGIAPDSITVPDVIGFTEEQAKAALEQAGFTGSVNTREEDSLEEEGSVASVTPAPGESAAPDQTITLGLSSGTIPLPDVTGRPEAEARATLTGAGFSDAQITTEQVDSDQPPGTVVGTTPGPSSPASTTTRIVLQVSGGPADLTVPTSILGQTEAQARQTLQTAGFTGPITTANIPAEPGETPGRVSFSDPEPGSTAPASTPITLYIAQTPPGD
jgi:serine/threonine-protein kinase